MRIGSFVSCIAEHPGIAPAELAELLGMSERTVREYVRQANAAMDGFAHITPARAKGYELEAEDEARYGQWMDAERAVSRSALPETPQERVAYLLNDLLMRTDWITLDELAGILFVSRSVVSKDLRAVERILESFNLRLAKRSHCGVRVEGSEMSRRLCLASAIMDRRDQLGGHAVSDMPSAASLDGLSELSNHALLDTISQSVECVARAHGFKINAMAYQNVLVHIAIALLRIRANCYVPMDEDSLDRVRGTQEYAVAQDIARGLSVATGAALPDEEAAYIAIHLAGKQTVDLRPEGGDAVISPEVWGIAEQMIARVWMGFRFDLRGDLELRMNLARHIAPLLVRLRYGMNMANPLLKDIQVRYALAYSMALDASTVLAERCGAAVSEDEVGYIALAFALALERQKTVAPKKNVLMVCASGAGSARLLEYQCRREFGDYVDQITTCDVMGLSYVDFSVIDYVFTTVPIEQKLPVPVREITYFLDTSEVEGIKRMLAEEPVSSAIVERFFKPQLFFAHQRFATKQQALDFLIEQASAQAGVPAEFGALVWKREEVVATSFGNNVAMPHPLEAVCDETFVSVCLLDEPVAWDEYGRTVRAVFLVAVEDGKNGDTKVLFKLLAELLTSKAAINELLDAQTWEVLGRLIQRFSPE